MSDIKPRFFKGLPGHTRQDDETLARDVEGSIYYWWWEYLRLSPAFWFARETGHPLVDPEMAKTYELAGNLKTRHFRLWWDETGIEVFPESKRPAKVNILDIENLQDHRFKEKAVYLEIPLTITKQTIFKKIREILNDVHDGRKLDVTSTADATFKLHTKKYRLRAIELEHWVLLYRCLYPSIKAWRIGDRLQISPHLKVRNVERKDDYGVQSRFNKLTSLTGRYLYKARYTLAHVERKSFPNTSKIILPENFMPFGERYHREYREAIGARDKKYKAEKNESAWGKWLHEEYAVILKYEIARRNRIEEKIKLPGSKVRLKLPDFISGKSDLLD
jgi:hypothetical protein